MKSHQLHNLAIDELIKILKTESATAYTAKLNAIKLVLDGKVTIPEDLPPATQELFNLVSTKVVNDD
ncbi:hypothetical protein ACGRPC_06070 [Vibrio diabolicus]|uniref:hypothetical protein n=1 Tax=Vibrio diabolicus TaxID=50719 RepID=UPI003749BCD8